MNKRKILTLFTALTLGLTSFSTIPMISTAADGDTSTVSDSEGYVVKEMGEVIFDADDLSVKVYTGDELNLDNVQLRFGIYHVEEKTYFSPLYDFAKFTVGSGINSEFYTIDTSQVDTTKPGRYYIVIKSKEGAVFKALSDYNTHYEITMQGNEGYLPVDVFDKDSVNDTPLYLRFFTEAIEAPLGRFPGAKLCGAMASDIRYEVEDENIARVTEYSNSEFLELECLKEGETTVNVYASDGRKTSEKIRVTPLLVSDDAPPTTTTTVYDPDWKLTTTTVVTVDKWWYEYEKNITTTTAVRTSTAEKTQTAVTTLLPSVKVDLETSDIKIIAADPIVTTVNEPEVWMWGTGVDHFDGIRTLPTKTIYNEGEELDLSGLAVNAYHSATKYSNKGNSETVRTDYVWKLEDIKPEYITINDLQGKSYKADQFAELKGGNAYIVNIGKNKYVSDIKVIGEEYEKDLYDTEGFSFRVYLNSTDKNLKFKKINNAEVESFVYGSTSKGFKLTNRDAFSIDMDANMHVGYSIESDIRQGDKVSGVLYINLETNYIIMGDIDIVKYGGEDGDANADGKVDMADIVMIMQSLANPDKYGLNGSVENHITKRGKALGDMDYNGLTVGDAQAIQRKLLGLDVDDVLTFYSERA